MNVNIQLQEKVIYKHILVVKIKLIYQFDDDIQSILQDCDDELTSSQYHFLRGDTDGDRYDERYNNSLSSWSIESENKLDNRI